MMYGVIDPLSGDTKSFRTKNRAIATSMQVLSGLYEEAKKVVVHHYTGSKILFDNQRLYRTLRKIIEAKKSGDLGNTLTLMMIDSFYKERERLHINIMQKGLNFKPILTEEVTLPGERLEYTLMYTHMDVPLVVIRDSYEGIFGREGFGKRPQLGLSKTEDTGEYIPNLMRKTFRDSFQGILNRISTEFPDTQMISSSHTNGGRGGVSCKLIQNDFEAFPHFMNAKERNNILIFKHKLKKPLIKKDRMSARKDAYSLNYHMFTKSDRGYTEVALMNRDKFPKKYTHYQFVNHLQNTKYERNGYGDLERDMGFSEIDLFDRIMKKREVSVKKRSTGAVKYSMKVRKPLVAIGTAEMRSDKIKRIIQGTYGSRDRTKLTEKLYEAIKDSLNTMYLSDTITDMLHSGLGTEEMPLHDIGYGIQIFCLQDFMKVEGSEGDKLYDEVNSILQVPLEEWGLAGGHMQVTPFRLRSMRDEVFQIMTKIYLRPLKTIKHLTIDVGEFYRTMNGIRHAQHELKEIRDKAIRYEDPNFLRRVGKEQAAKKANGYIPGYWRTLNFLFKALAIYWGKSGKFEDEVIEIEGDI